LLFLSLLLPQSATASEPIEVQVGWADKDVMHINGTVERTRVIGDVSQTRNTTYSERLDVMGANGNLIVLRTDRTTKVTAETPADHAPLDQLRDAIGLAPLLAVVVPGRGAVTVIDMETTIKTAKELAGKSFPKKLLKSELEEQALLTRFASDTLHPMVAFAGSTWALGEFISPLPESQGSITRGAAETPCVEGEPAVCIRLYMAAAGRWDTFKGAMTPFFESHPSLDIDTMSDLQGSEMIELVMEPEAFRVRSFRHEVRLEATVMTQTGPVAIKEERKVENRWTWSRRE
jgi:hypothetical protein